MAGGDDDAVSGTLENPFKRLLIETQGFAPWRAKAGGGTSRWRRSYRGCWTCRLRRKKCDEGLPVCAGCASLDIDCQYGDQKPRWMDGGERQKQKAQEITAEIRRKARVRRDQRNILQSLDPAREGPVELSTEPDGNHPRRAPAGPGRRPSRRRRYR